MARIYFVEVWRQTRVTGCSAKTVGMTTDTIF